MNITRENFNSAVKVKSEPSSLISGLWISRSVIGVNANGKQQALLGFSAGFDKDKCEINSTFELLERLVFLPNLYDKKFLEKPVVFVSENLDHLHVKGYIHQFLVGSEGPQRQFYGNGCAIFDTPLGAIIHSRNELIERHLCCEIWYKRSIKLRRDHGYEVSALNPFVKIKFYTIKDVLEFKFAIVVLECLVTGFFVVGSAIRSNLKSAYDHALGEVGMIFEDFVKRRDGNTTSVLSNKKILSLRNREISQRRKEYFNDLEDKTTHDFYAQPDYQSIFFEPLPGIYAARTFSNKALDPRLFEAVTSIPTLPLF